MKMHKNTFGMGISTAAVIGATLAVSPVAAADATATSPARAGPRRAGSQRSGCLAVDR